MKYRVGYRRRKKPGVDSSGLSVWCVVVHASDSEVAVDPTLTMALLLSRFTAKVVAIELLL